jgi:3-hydroxyacyl-CoA dehydrogenase
MRVRHATVIGAGVMGSAIAAHLANAGVPVLLLDLAPAEPSDEDRAAGRTLAHPEVRTRLARAGKERALRASPPAFFVSDLASLVSVGSVDDDLHRVRESDWVIEAIVEELGAKRALLEAVERHRQPGAIVSTNTSGLSVAAMGQGRSEPFRRHFLGTHFFNPPRYMRLVELVPTADTAPEVLRAAAEFVGRALGKGIVVAKDTPNFIANRIGAYTSCLTLALALDGGYTVEEVDALTGPLIGRPRTATFRLADLVGLDTAYRVRKHVYDSLPHDPEREVFAAHALLGALVERGWLGDKSGRGFYWRRGDDTLVLDLRTLDYRPQRPPVLPSLARVGTIDDLGERVRALLRAGDRAAAFVWRLLSGTLVYAARVLPEISDDVVNVDRAMRWGFNWELGPFELWDALGPREVVARLEAEGHDVPPVAAQVLRDGEGRFYGHAGGRRVFFDTAAAGYRPVPSAPGVLVLADLAAAGRAIERTAAASLIDLGDGVACLALHSGTGTFGPDVLRLLDGALDRLERDLEALVIGTQARDFSAGADLRRLLAASDAGHWAALEQAIRQFQQLVQRVRRSPRPVVGAPTGRALGRGAELCLACARLQAAAETSMGLADSQVGLIPAGGGTMEMARRAQARIPREVAADLLPLLRWVFETILGARVSRSALEARQLGYLRDADGITMDPDRLIQDARDAALGMARLGYRSPPPSPIRVGGERVRAALYTLLRNLRTAGHITAYDEVVGRRLAHVLAGGGVPDGTWVSEEYLLDLEREAFLGLLGEAGTRERIRHMVETGKPLRN